jgi:hypothetical protein
MMAVHAKTLSRWAARGLVGSYRTPGGHHRYLLSELRALLGEGRE